MPKSSIATRTPSALIRRRVARARTGSRTRAVSVISSSRRAGARPVVNRTSWTSSAKPGAWSCTAETLTAMRSGLSQEAASRQLSRRTHSPIPKMLPVSSEIGMNRSGGTVPRSGWCQRKSASNPTTVPLSIAICGW
ncbi:hypothetical protein VQ03_21510 [Methylobacterium tarhaniae]|uniref:Uncharacterized protein n=1 Tax=Methylobacterium tarhaniae TaxID=1187852 RepID=A0A0J6V9G9_9HYPH|nr:hypothetical protein VQ03_21510 [Methylobacterium tarhaniae]